MDTTASPDLTGDLCQYTLHPPPAALNTELSTFLSDVLSFALAQTAGYIWHRDGFNLQLSSEAERCLKGESRVGDAVEDEWFLVWLLKRITQHWPGAAAQIQDSDGEFLLIEAADQLPKWVTPENASNRVWLHQGQLHLIPLEHTSPSPPSLDEEPEAQGYLSPDDAVKLVCDPNVSTLAEEKLQSAALSRTVKYPEAIQSEAHHTLAFVPKDIARALMKNQQLIAPAVGAFYERDPLQLKACQQMRRFPPATAQLTRVKLSRTLYAQLQGQRFFPPKPFERVKWFDNVEKDSVDWRRKDVGMKIACGFEMLYEETRHTVKSSKPFAKDAATTVDSDPAFKRFLGNLTNIGYFQGELPGSRKYTDLLHTAQSQWQDMRADGHALPSFAEQVDSASKATGDDDSLLELSEQQGLQEDSDEWMNLDEEGLEALLQSRAGAAGLGAEQQPEEMDEQAKKLGGLAQQFESFVQGKGDLEGALFEDELDDDEDSDSDEDEQPVAPKKTAEEKQQDQDALVAPLPESEWGQKESTAPPPPPSTAETANDISKPRLEPESYEGASDDSSEASDLDEPEDEAGNIREAEQEEPDVDMSGEMHDFLNFTRDALGLSEQQYADIIKSRQDRGAFVPGDAPPPPRASSSSASKMDLDDIPPVDTRPSEPVASQSNRPRGKGFHLQAPQKNPRLDNFEALMDAMDGALAQAQAESSTSSRPVTSASKAPLSLDDPQPDEDTEMDAELAELLKHDPDDPNDRLNSGQYHLLKNLLASFDSQEGMAGPVSNLAGRLAPDIELPRNQQ